ncbi:MAG: helix-turn-helix domain-containing protein [bacterium]|nr:helix-turn-helix domain-containing protein [bacterium]
MKELGEYLRQARTSNGVSLTEAAEDLELSTSQLENIESGNVKAFKDVYDLKSYVIQYAKYLGLDSEKVVDEFNGFLFEHTSKISLEDIKAAQKKIEDSEKKVQSPYTKTYTKKIGPWPFICVFLGFILLILIIYWVISTINRVPVRSEELLPDLREELIYEFTY